MACVCRRGIAFLMLCTEKNYAKDKKMIDYETMSLNHGAIKKQNKAVETNATNRK